MPAVGIREGVGSLLKIVYTGWFSQANPVITHDL
jgi:hypothetical protein